MIEAPEQPPEESFINPIDKFQSEAAERLARIKKATGAEVRRFAPQQGKQWAFSGTPVDFGWYGGAAGAGKSFVLLYEAIRHAHNPLFRAVAFRKTFKQIKQPGGLWDKAHEIYKPAGATFNGDGFCTFRAGGRVNFSHMQHEKNKYDWDGAEIALSLWDELIHFTETQYLYVTLSRARSLSGIRPYNRAGMNPDPDGWPRRWVDWYIGPDGWPLEERGGVIRYFFRDGNDIVWGDNPEDMLLKYPKKRAIDIKSFTFIPAKLSDNAILESIDPAYRGNIEAMPYVQRLRLQGNWNVRANQGSYFKKHFFTVVDLVPNQILAVIRMWDFAGTEPTEQNPDPDWLRGGLYFITSRGTFGCLDMVGERVGPGDVEPIIMRTAQADREAWGARYTVGLEVEPASMSKILADQFARKLRGYNVWIYRPDKNKELRATPAASHAQNVGFLLLRGGWNESFIDEHYAFPQAPHDDQVDTTSGAYEFLTSDNVSNLIGYRDL